ncbi:aminoglycoside phosphotransferase family protein [Motiliproteus sp. SC1-56]|uniref:aminoglycoside phosphotransferase family protein n=1 Tax=Motiliproteus sp. SC1-56 TaxID=2799565 RepID=UPI001A8C4AB1|nr:phosphotransferase [Motiliproteus sp. SC1-56]
MDKRLEALRKWVGDSLPAMGVDLAHDWTLTPVSGDASFRRYFRVHSHNLSWVAVDAPPEQEDSVPFVAIARAWEPLEIHAPRVFRADLEQGFMLLSDLGDTLYLDRLDPDSADHLYRQALVTLTHIQQCRHIQGRPLPPYDESLLRREMALFREWFLQRLLGLLLSAGEQQLLDGLFTRLVDSALEQPRVCVHRDYHSRNLMVTDDAVPGVIDFQDAVLGPVTYDLVSLLRDCYIDWPQGQVEQWALSYLDLARESGIFEPVAPERFLRWFDLMGMQRHLKAIGIFARLKLRDGKGGYLADIPRTLGYLLSVGARHPDSEAFTDFLRTRVEPVMATHGAFAAEALQ